MDWMEALIARLAGTAALAALAQDRISWFDRQRGDGVPALVLTAVFAGREWTHDGPDELDRPTVQFDCWAEVADQAVSLARELRLAMEAGGDATTAGGSSWRFHPAQLTGFGSEGEVNPDGGARLYRIRHDYEFHVEEI